jgi:DNA helicase IV
MDGVAPGRWRLEELHVNYRTPRVIIDEAAALAAAHGLAVPMQQTLRDGDRPVEHLEVASVHQVVDAVQSELAALGTGRLAVIAATGSGPFGTETVHAHLVDALGADEVGSGANALDRSVAVLDARSSKGLEVDVVVVVDPDGLRSAGGAHGVNDLYVAMTRATQHLIVMTPGTPA